MNPQPQHSGNDPHARPARITPFPIDERLGAPHQDLPNHALNANAVAVELRRELAERGREITELRAALDKSQHNFKLMQAALGELRRENDRLIANGTPSERKFVDIVSERDRLRAEINALRMGLTTSADEMSAMRLDAEAMRAEIGSLKQQLAGASRHAPAAHNDVQSSLAIISTRLDQIYGLLKFSEKPAPAAPSTPKTGEDVIDISFGQ